MSDQRSALVGVLFASALGAMLWTLVLVIVLFGIGVL